MISNRRRRAYRELNGAVRRVQEHGGVQHLAKPLEDCAAWILLREAVEEVLLNRAQALIEPNIGTATRAQGNHVAAHERNARSAWTARIIRSG